MSDSTLRKAVIRLAHANPELRGDLLPLLKEAAYDTLGTSWRFKAIPGRLGTVYSVEVDRKTYRIAPERDHWRLDYAGMLGHVWEAVTPTRYGSPEEAAQDLVRLYKQRKLGPQF